MPEGKSPSPRGLLQLGPTAAVADELLRSVLEAAPAFILGMKPEGEILFINRLVPGISAEDVMGKTAFEFMDPSSHAVARACFERVVRTREPDGYESIGLGPNREARTYETRVAPVIRDGEVVALTLVANDITARKRTEAALRESEERLRVTVAGTGMGLWSWDPARDVVEWDARLLEIAGLGPDQAPRTIAEYLALVHPDDRPALAARSRAAADEGTIQLSEYRFVRPDGEVRWVQVRGRAVRDPATGTWKVWGGTLDVTERRAVDERLRQSQKMEAVGQLTAGIAHNFNNLLMAILPNLELAARVPPAEASRLLADARHAAERAADLIRQLLLFAVERHPAARTVQHVGPIVERALSICRGTFDPGIAIEVRHADRIPPVEVDDGQIEQVVLNLCLNARDALQGHPAPRLSLSVQRLSATSPPVREHAGALRRTHIRVVVRDNGEGMDEATRRRVFEPFFTTKPVGKGTGLGLATAYAILEAHRGWMTVESTPGAGTAVSFYLPAADGRPSVAAAEGEAPLARGRGERILVVDDDRLVREAVARLLTDAGYVVVTAEGAHAGQHAYDHQAGGFALVLLDISMPDGSGREVCRRLKERRPGQRVVYFSGNIVDGTDDADGVVHKPIGAADLLAEVRRVLDARDQGATAPASQRARGMPR